MPETADKKIDVLLKLSMHKARSFELYNFLSNFVDKEQQKQEHKQNTRELREKIAKKIPYEEKISSEVSELREERF